VRWIRVLVSSVACAASAWLAALWISLSPVTPNRAELAVLAARALSADLRATRSLLDLSCERDVQLERLALELAAGATETGATRLQASLQRALGGEVSLFVEHAGKLAALTPGAEADLELLRPAARERIAVPPFPDLFDACARRQGARTLWLLRRTTVPALLQAAGLEPNNYLARRRSADPSLADLPELRIQTQDGGGLFVEVPHFDDVEAREVRMLLFGLPGALLGALLGLFFTRQTPIDESVLATLEKAAERVAQGDLSSQIGVRFGGRADQTVRSFDRMTAELRDMRGKLAEAERAATWQDMAQRIAHEIKNPLSPIRMALETLRKARDKRLPAFDEIFEESTRVMLEEVQRMEHIVREFSDFARLPKARPGAMTLGQLLEETAGLYTPEDVELELLTPDDEAPIHADREQLTQVLTNLIANAVHAARLGAAGPRLRLSLTQTGHETVLQVEDNGPGVPETERERIFEPYVTDKSEGTGLGLSIARRIVNDHGGSIGVDASPMGGARFTLSLPGARS
jgi:signal transduction histidine kinase